MLTVQIALLLVIFGFFQPVACDQPWFELAETLFDFEEFSYTVAAIGLYIVFFAALASIVYTVYLFVVKKDICVKGSFKIDFIILLASIAGGVITFLFILNEFDVDCLDTGCYFILVG